MTTTTEKLTITRALAEAKILPDRIGKAIGGGLFIGVVEGSEQKPNDKGFKDRAEMEARFRADNDRVLALMGRLAAIKLAIAKANVSTLVTIAGREMTISEAVELKRNLSLQDSFLRQLKAAKQNNVAKLDSLNKDLENKILSLVQHSFQNVQKPTEEQFNSVANPQKAAFAPLSLDPLNLNEKISQLENWLTDTRLNLDYALSEVNAKTEIEVPVVA